MKKISILKIIVALCICNVYVFTCGVMGTVSSVAVEKPADSSAVTDDTPVPDEGANGQGTVDFIIPDADINTGNTINVEFNNFRQPDIADKVIQTTCAPVGENPEVMDDIDFDIIIPDETPYDDYIVIPDEVIPEQTTTAATTTTPATTTTRATTTPATTTTRATTTPATTTTRATTTTPATTTTRATTTTSATTTTPATTTTTRATTTEGIPVEATTTTPEPQQPDEGSINEGAASEILTVKSNGEIISGNAVDIIAGITQNEVGYTFAPEAIKAQAVAAYTYVQFCNKYGTYPNVIVAKNVKDSVKVLVESVIGECVYYDGEIIQAVYSASSAGYTASSENVWGNYYPYLISKYCELDKLYDPNYGRTAVFTSSDIRNRVLNATGIYLEGDPYDWFTIEDYVEGYYVGQMNIGGYHSYTNSNGKTVKLTGKVFRESIMGYNIRSHAFDIEYDENTDSFVITTYGYGHGVGLSQNGANALATYWGYDYTDILTFYYEGCEVY